MLEADAERIGISLEHGQQWVALAVCFGKLREPDRLAVVMYRHVSHQPALHEPVARTPRGTGLWLLKVRHRQGSRPDGGGIVRHHVDAQAEHGQIGRLRPSRIISQ